MLKVSGLIHNILKQSDFMITWMTLQIVYLINDNINNKEEANYKMLITSMS